jgi:hypothetical protein
MQNVAETYRNSAAAAQSGTGAAAEVADGDAFARELGDRIAKYDTDKISASMDRLASAFPGTDITSQMIGSFESSATFFLEIEGGTSINISPDVMEQLGGDDAMFDKVKSMIGSLFSAGESQSLMPSSPNGGASTRTVAVGMEETRYVEVQRDANGRALSMGSLKLQTMQIIAEQTQRLFQGLNGGGNGGGGFPVNGDTSSLWQFLAGGSAAVSGGRNQGGEGFGKYVSGSFEWEMQGMFTNTSESQKMLENNKQFVGQMDVIIDMWEDSGTKADLFTYMQVMGLSDPLVFDLGGEGINLTAAEDGVCFDIKGDGSKPRTGWISGNNAFLYLDETGNGVADDANELFGDHGGFANGFDKLAQHDGNGDGVIDANDSVYDKLRFWRDANGDGVNQAEESLTLAEAGVAPINLGYDKRYEMDQHGNVLGERSLFTRADGSQGVVVDAWLRQKLSN